jgi:hypothetical protein
MRTAENDRARGVAEGAARELEASLAQMRVEATRRNEHIARLAAENRKLRMEVREGTLTIAKLREEILISRTTSHTEDETHKGSECLTERSKPSPSESSFHGSSQQTREHGVINDKI